MAELKACPFCGARAEVLTDGVRTWGLIEHRDGCLFPAFPKHELAECDFGAWNTRAERTCGIEERKNAWGSVTRHCGNCGADLRMAMSTGGDE